MSQLATLPPAPDVGAEVSFIVSLLLREGQRGGLVDKLQEMRLKNSTRQGIPESLQGSTVSSSFPCATAASAAAATVGPGEAAGKGPVLLSVCKHQERSGGRKLCGLGVVQRRHKRGHIAVACSEGHQWVWCCHCCDCPGVRPAGAGCSDARHWMERDSFDTGKRNHMMRHLGAWCAATNPAPSLVPGIAPTDIPSPSPSDCRAAKVCGSKRRRSSELPSSSPPPPPPSDEAPPCKIFLGSPCCSSAGSSPLQPSRCENSKGRNHHPSSALSCLADIDHDGDGTSSSSRQTSWAANDEVGSAPRDSSCGAAMMSPNLASRATSGSPQSCPPSSPLGASPSASFDGRASLAEHATILGSCKHKSNSLNGTVCGCSVQIREHKRAYLTVACSAGHKYVWCSHCCDCRNSGPGCTVSTHWMERDSFDTGKRNHMQRHTARAAEKAAASSLGPDAVAESVGPATSVMRPIARSYTPPSQPAGGDVEHQVATLKLLQALTPTSGSKSASSPSYYVAVPAVPAKPLAAVERSGLDILADFALQMR